MSKDFPPLPILERTDRFLRFLASLEESPGCDIHQINYHPHEENFLLALSWLESSLKSIENQKEEMRFFIDYLKYQGWIKVIGKEPFHGSYHFQLTVGGYVRLSELQEAYIPSTTAFIAMWFDDSMNEAYEQGIAPAVRDAGYKPIRIDRMEHINKIDDEIIAEIRRARFVVADFTHGDTGARGGVYYEAGFAHGLGKTVILSCRGDKMKEVHFDTRQYNHIIWKNPNDMRDQLAKRISAVLGDGPIKSIKA